MSYHYEDTGYADYGNHGDDGYDEYEPYSDYMEPDHWEPEPTPSEPNYHEYDHITDPTEYSHHTNCEYNADDANREVNEAHQPQWSKYEGAKVQELEELIHDGDGMEWEGGYEGYEHEELVYEPKHKVEANYAEHNAEAGYAEHGPHRFEYNDKQRGEYTPHSYTTRNQIPHHNNNPNPPPLSPTQNPPTPRNYSDINVLLQDI
ncbi:hypothetical protein PILCRDRAFT_11372 [Piloderma croceum F 1598]|uniref:Uncharacterized protein n=1 Tax=Piloderma croceum (strain F 1598) TaxID=765440 RepID=A0A0C3AVW7_PILCF|nr:hypothetical protein PILCRDRAFT_11372 [Piloderma croceum F 1598]